MKRCILSLLEAQLTFLERITKDSHLTKPHKNSKKWLHSVRPKTGHNSSEVDC